jgi:catechol 2,3-dioxygenase-like lactoylglutathione lyase family enzyme
VRFLIELATRRIYLAGVTANPDGGWPAQQARQRGAGAAPVGGLGDDGVMEVLSSRVLLRPTDPERSRAFYRDVLGLAVSREFGSGPERGTVFFLGGGLLEVSGRAATPPTPGMALWLQVRELAKVRRKLGERGVRILREPTREPWVCWRCGSPTRTGCASAWWRCRRSIRCAEETEEPGEACLGTGMDGRSMAWSPVTRERRAPSVPEAGRGWNDPRQQRRRRVR